MVRAGAYRLQDVAPVRFAGKLGVPWPFNNRSGCFCNSYYCAVTALLPKGAICGWDLGLDDLAVASLMMDMEEHLLQMKQLFHGPFQPTKHH